MRQQPARGSSASSRSAGRPVLLGCLALLLAGCGGGGGEPDEDASEFVSVLVHDVAAGRHDAAWERLHPRHQDAATRGEYARCEARDPLPGALSRLEILATFDEPVSVAGAGRLDSTAVRMRLTVGSDEPFVSTFHAVAVDGRWTWFMPAARYRAYSAGRCPAG